MATTAGQIRAAMSAINLDEVAHHFHRADELEEPVAFEQADDIGDADEGVDEGDNRDDSIAPFVVCDGVSVDAFNEYIAGDEDLKIGARFLELTADARLLVVDFPTVVHEATADQFTLAFVQACGNDEDIASFRSTRVDRAGQPSKEADAAFGPIRGTPNSTVPLAGEPWITLAVEVGRAQSWVSLRNAARRWFLQPGIHYVLLIKISACAHLLGYELFNVTLPRPSDHNGLPHPVRAGHIRPSANDQPVIIGFNAHDILAIPPGEPLPAGVNNPINVDLRRIMARVMRIVG